MIGSRYVPGGATPNWPWYRLAISKGGNLYARTLLGFRVRDSTAGFRVYSRRALTSFPLDEVRAEGYGFQVEMTYRVRGAGGTITEVPIEFRDRELGTSKMSGRIVLEALRARRLVGAPRPGPAPGRVNARVGATLRRWPTPCTSGSSRRRSSNATASSCSS